MGCRWFAVKQIKIDDDKNNNDNGAMIDNAILILYLCSRYLSLVTRLGS